MPGASTRAMRRPQPVFLNRATESACSWLQSAWLRSSWLGRTCLASAGLVLLASSARADAFDDTTHWRALARTRGYAGLEAYRRGDYSLARSQLEEAFALFPAPSLGLWLARTRAQLGQLTEAALLYNRVAHLPALDSEASLQTAARLTAEEELTVLLGRLPTLKVDPQGDTAEGASLWLDGVSITANGARLPLDPGRHVLVARAGSAQAEVSVPLAESEHRVASVLFAEPGRAPQLAVDSPEGEPRAVQASELTERANVPLPPALSANPKRASALGDMGLAAYQQKDFARAAEQLEAAFRLMPTPTYGLYAARSLSQRGRLIEAASLYREASVAARASEPEKHAAEKRNAEAELRQLLARRLPLLRILVVDALRADVTLSLDGKALESTSIGEEWAVDPGTHTLVARHGSETINLVTRLAEGERRDTILEFHPDYVSAQALDVPRAASPDSTMRIQSPDLSEAGASPGRVPSTR
jgi:tetratricopeptide (TPR) repeat protein